MPTAQDIWIATWIRNRAGQDHSQTLPELDCFDHFFQGVLILASQSKSITCIHMSWMFNMFEKFVATMCWFQDFGAAKVFVGYCPDVDPPCFQ